MSCIWGHAVKVSQKCGADPIARKTKCMSSKNWKVLFYRFQNFQADSIPKQVKNLSNIFCSVFQYFKHSIHWSPNQEQHLWFKRSALPGVLLGKPCVSRGPDRAQVTPQHVTPKQTAQGWLGDSPVLWQLLHERTSCRNPWRKRAYHLMVASWSETLIPTWVMDISEQLVDALDLVSCMSDNKVEKEVWLCCLLGLLAVKSCRAVGKQICTDK